MEYGAVESWVEKYNMGAYLPRGLEQDISFKDSKFYLNSGFVKVLCLLKNGETLLEYECRALAYLKQFFMLGTSVGLTQLLRLGVQKNKSLLLINSVHSVLFVIAAVLVSAWNCVIV
ncbi:hypothetical protein H0E87_016885 [Populus deltoides]|uniref:Uncharacterized protein n=1 Tax=Populus deltoides TaxID=3696 RepID=A0A8T2XY65_POPDE|nr:hypothetical protein H0E87_016885 [Populus deltoides]